MALPQMQEPYDDEDESPQLRRVERRTEGARVAWWWIWIIVVCLVIWWAAWGWGGSGGWLRGRHGNLPGTTTGPAGNGTGGATTPGDSGRGPSNGNTPATSGNEGTPPQR
jgi:hypothetical protein